MTTDTDQARTPRIALLLDRSGSMESCREDALAGVNSYLRKVADDPALIGGRITLLTFDDVSTDTVRDDVPLATWPQLQWAEFEPRGLTPLLDAVGRAIGLLDGYKGRADDPRILVVLTDGLENASREHTRESISALIRARQAAGWLIVYLGANQDSWGEARQLGLEQGAVADVAFEKHQQLASMLASTTHRFMSCGLRSFTDEERAQAK